MSSGECASRCRKMDGQVIEVLRRGESTERSLAADPISCTLPGSLRRREECRRRRRTRCDSSDQLAPKDRRRCLRAMEAACSSSALTSAQVARLGKWRSQARGWARGSPWRRDEGRARR